MNRYPLWKYIVVIVAVLIGIIYTLPNFYGETPAVQISSAKSTVKLSAGTVDQIRDILTNAQISFSQLEFEQNNSTSTIRVRFPSNDIQLKAKELIENTLNPDSADPSYIVAVSLLPASPAWLSALHANPMYLGLDLRGGVHFLLQVDMKGALENRYAILVNDLRSTLRDKNVTVESITSTKQNIVLNFSSDAGRQQAIDAIRNNNPDLSLLPTEMANGYFPLTAQLNDDAIRKVKETALSQNINTLHNRVNELGVAEPVIQQQGLDRIVVELPGVQDIAKAKDILGRTATLEIRLVDSSFQGNDGTPVPYNLEVFKDPMGASIAVQRQVYLTGENLQDAQATIDPQKGIPAVSLRLDSKGSRVFADLTRENVGKRLAIILFEKGKGQVVTAPSINEPIPGGQVQISGSMSLSEAQDTALLLRAGSLAAPMEIIEERTVGPSLGADNIKKGFDATLYGFIAIAIFITLYYALMGMFSTVALAVNLLLLVAVLSMLQATLTLPGIAAIALTIGMAIDANVLINERIREELRNGASAQQAIHLGFDRAWGTILDSNITTLIAGLALLAFGSGPIRGFAVVHCIGILTSMFSSVVVSRSMSNLWYGRRKKLQKISIGTVWKPTDKA